ncbi:hypothetical protein V6N12_062232 [Hibiscus sabdariffa]|uniref:Uncharacterized protein n=1 Tax=Hibiscus sabdariffa TaxID=183260 RepID=A0ABR2F8H1_9ROSI
MRNMMGYSRVAKRSCRRGRTKGLRLNILCRRFWVQGLRARFLYLFNQIRRLRSYFRSLFRKMGTRGSGRRRSLVMPNEVPWAHSCRLRSPLGRSNSFYSEAISDCLEFIKRSSVSHHPQTKPSPLPLPETYVSDDLSLRILQFHQKNPTPSLTLEFK